MSATRRAVSLRDGSKELQHSITTSFVKSKIGKEMKIPALTDLAKDVKRIAEALTKLAEVAQQLVEQQEKK